MRMELEVIADIIVNPKSKKPTSKEIIYKKEFELDNIYLEQYIDSKGKIQPKFCAVVEGDKYFKVNHAYDYLRSFTRPVVVQGLMAKSKLNEKRNTKSKRV